MLPPPLTVAEVFLAASILFLASNGVGVAGVLIVSTTHLLLCEIMKHKHTFPHKQTLNILACVFETELTTDAASLKFSTDCAGVIAADPPPPPPDEMIRSECRPIRMTVLMAPSPPFRSRAESQMSCCWWCEGSGLFPPGAGAEWPRRPRRKRSSETGAERGRSIEG